MNEFENACDQVKDIAEAAHAVFGDLNGFGAQGLKDQRVLAKVSESRRALLEAALLLSEAREEHVKSQIRKLELADAGELKLHFGCGAHELEGWVNIDFAPAQFSMNLNWDLPIGEAKARYIFSCHVLEHLYYPSEVRPFLERAYRLLAPGGVMRIMVPDAEQIFRAYARKDEEFFREGVKTWQSNPKGTQLEKFMHYLGAGRRPSVFTEHKFCFDFETLQAALHRAGFDRVSRSAYMQSEHSALRIDNRSRVPTAHSTAHEFSLYVEAVREGS